MSDYKCWWLNLCILVMYCLSMSFCTNLHFVKVEVRALLFILPRYTQLYCNLFLCMCWQLKLIIIIIIIITHTPFNGPFSGTTWAPHRLNPALVELVKTLPSQCSSCVLNSSWHYSTVSCQCDVAPCPLYRASAIHVVVCSIQVTRQ